MAPEANMDETYDFLLLIFLLLFGTLIVLAFIVNVWIPYQDERSYIKMEIQRSDGEEREYWKHVLREFYISHIPIFGRIILKIYRR